MGFSNSWIDSSNKNGNDILRIHSTNMIMHVKHAVRQRHAAPHIRLFKANNSDSRR
jgi:hypothetical protein